MKGLLVGYGSIGRRHLSNFHRLGVTQWAVVRSGQGSVAFDPPGEVQTFTSLTEALETAKPTFAVVANPTNLHLETALACVAAGCHLLLEKPVSQSLDGLDELAAAAQAKGVQILVGFQFRFHPALMRMAELLRDKTLGDPIHARLVWGEYLPSWQPGVDWQASYAARPELGGGVHLTICHPIDYLRMLFGDPLHLRGTLTTHGPLGLDVAEAADALLSFPGGLTVALHLDYWSQPTVHRVEIVCTGGSIEWDYIAGSFRSWDAGAGVWHNEDHPGLAERNDLFLAEASHFLDVIAGRAEPVCTLADGIRVVELCHALERSSTELPHG